jgi:hypothetical protein
MITHVIGSLRVIHDFVPTPGLFPNTFALLELRNRRRGYVRLRERS